MLANPSMLAPKLILIPVTGTVNWCIYITKPDRKTEEGGGGKREVSRDWRAALSMQEREWKHKGEMRRQQ